LQAEFAPSFIQKVLGKIVDRDFHSQNLEYIQLLTKYTVQLKIELDSMNLLCYPDLFHDTDHEASEAVQKRSRGELPNYFQLKHSI
jgi:hypothetical protein